MESRVPAPFDGPQPHLLAGRLVLRPFTLADAPVVEPLIDDPEVAAGTLRIPHPYPPGAAAGWIAEHADKWAAARLATWAITLAADGAILGAMSLRFTLAHRRAELGYWVARAAWGRGYATEAARATIAWGFDVAGLHRIDAHHYVENPASGAVLRKAGMRHEGLRRGAVFRDDVPRDLEEYAILRTDPRS